MSGECVEPVYRPAEFLFSADRDMPGMRRFLADAFLARPDCRRPRLENA